MILASDGVHTLDTAEIQRVVSDYAGDGAEAVAGALIRAVEGMRDPHQDSTTIIAVRPIPEKQPLAACCSLNVLARATGFG